MLIDIHCHILPALDDGAAGIDEALGMAFEAVKDGIHTIVATPHHGNGKYDNEAASVDAAVSKFNAELQLRDIPLTVMSGQEVRVYDSLLGDLAAGKIRTLNGTRYLLLELPSYGITDAFEELLYELSILQITPIIAHPERNLELADNPERLRTYIEMGALCQITSQSLTGKFGRKVQKTAMKLCQLDLTHFIASDAHNLSTRPGELKQGYGLIQDLLGEERVNYYQLNANFLIRNESIPSQAFSKTKRRRFLFVD